MSDDGKVEVTKLKVAGDAVTFDVRTAGLLSFGDYPEIEFTGIDLGGRAVTVRVPKQSADRQIARLQLAQPSDLIGHRLTIKRDKNDKQPTKPFWGLYLESNGNGKASSATAPATAPVTTSESAPAAPSRREKRSAIYLAQTKWVLDTIVPMYRAAKVEPNANDIHAMVSTLFIAETRNGS